MDPYYKTDSAFIYLSIFSDFLPLSVALSHEHKSLKSLEKNNHYYSCRLTLTLHVYPTLLPTV